MDEALKQRLVGALVVGTFAVVVVPWLLGEPEAPPVKREVVPAIPLQAPALPLLPLPTPETREPVAAAPMEPAAPLPLPAEAISPSSTVVGPSPPSESVAASAPIAAPRLASVGAWQVQAASLSSEEGAGRLVKRLQDAGLDARSERSGRFWRVYVVGLESREDADGVRAQLQLEFSLSGVILKVTS